MFMTQDSETQKWLREADWMKPKGELRSEAELLPEMLDELAEWLGIF